jgi:hypothetical protein
VAFDLADVAFVPEGMVLTLRRRKTDQAGKGTEVAIPFDRSERTCPVLTLKAWVATARISAGALFLSVSRHGWVSERRLS